MAPLYIIKQAVQLVGSFKGPDQYTTPTVSFRPHVQAMLRVTIIVHETGKVYLFLESWGKPGTYSYTIMWDNYGKRTGIPEILLIPVESVKA